MITFQEIVANRRPPQRASRSAAGTLPDRHRRCPPVRAASGLGWYLFLPVEFTVVFDGVRATISLDDGDTWYDLEHIRYPDLSNEHPPMASMTVDHGIMQIWPGYQITTPAGFSTLVRGPVNFIGGSTHQIYEGLIETDTWVGPLITAVRLLKTDVPIHFRADMPFIQLVPMRTADYADLRRS